MKIALILPYYGKLPTYFNLFLRSLRGMKLDVLFFSDLEVTRHPDNFKVIRMTFDEFKELAAKKLKYDVRMDSPKRLCDFKPMYGKIFEDYLKDYDYWAFGDCDLVYGRKFNDVLSAAIRANCEVFSIERCFTAGPFTMLRNGERCNELFRTADNWREVVSCAGEKCVAFDELHGDWHDEVRTGKMTLDDCRRHADSFSAVVMRAQGIRREMSDVVEQSDLAHGEVVRFAASGELFLNDRPIAIYHYVRPKQRRYFTLVPTAYDGASECLIDDAGFYVTAFQRSFRRLINKSRKLRAALRSLRRNGLARLSPRWSEQFK